MEIAELSASAADVDRRPADMWRIAPQALHEWIHALRAKTKCWQRQRRQQRQQAARSRSRFGSAVCNSLSIAVTARLRRFFCLNVPGRDTPSGNSRRRIRGPLLGGRCRPRVQLCTVPCLCTFRQVPGLPRGRAVLLHVPAVSRGGPRPLPLRQPLRGGLPGGGLPLPAGRTPSGRHMGFGQRRPWPVVGDAALP